MSSKHPLSIYRLEKYYLGLLSHEETKEIEELIAQDTNLQERLRQMDQDRLIPLKALDEKYSIQTTNLRNWFWQWFTWPVTASFTTAAALSLLILFWNSSEQAMDEGFKGDQDFVSIIAVRRRVHEDNQIRIERDKTIFFSGDGLSLELSCTPPRSLHVSIIAKYNADKEEILFETPDLHCENAKPLGAFVDIPDGAIKVCARASIQDNNSNVHETCFSVDLEH